MSPLLRSAPDRGSGFEDLAETEAKARAVFARSQDITGATARRSR